MPRKDVLHDSAKNALIKDGWIITHDPLLVEYDRAMRSWMSWMDAISLRLNILK